jgi:hypothetical protein
MEQDCFKDHLKALSEVPSVLHIMEEDFDADKTITNYEDVILLNVIGMHNS